MESSINQRIKKIIDVTEKSVRFVANEIGISQASLHSIVTGQTKPSFDTLQKLVEKYQINPDWLLTGRGGMQKNVSNSTNLNDFYNEIILLYLQFFKKYPYKNHNDNFFVGFSYENGKLMLERKSDLVSAEFEQIISKTNQFFAELKIAPQPEKNNSNNIIFTYDFLLNLPKQYNYLKISNENENLIAELEFKFKPDGVLNGKMPQKKQIELAQNTDKNAIYLYDVSAAAGYGSFDEMISNEKVVGKYLIPDFKNVDWMIYVRGSSMYPKYSSGDIIGCRVLHESRFIQWGKVYVVATREQGILVKRLEKSEIKDCILAVSDNQNYKSFDIPTNEILGIALVVGVLRLE
jgi:phage repressor protein C with HTH and peptisase S24 domain/plasmid maintenance system antidote protein VapI